MSLRDRRKLFFVAALVLVANLFDLASTYYASPDLAGEWNVLQRFFGLGWAGLIGAKLFGGWLAILGYAYYLRHRQECYPGPGLGRVAFSRHFAFGGQVSWLQMQYRIPRPQHLWVNLGYFWAGLQVLIFWVALDNVLLRYGIVLKVREYSELGYHLAQSWIVAGLVLMRFHLGNYHRYRAVTAAKESAHISEPAVEWMAG